MMGQFKYRLEGREKSAMEVLYICKCPLPVNSNYCIDTVRL